MIEFFLLTIVSGVFFIAIMLYCFFGDNWNLSLPAFPDPKAVGRWYMEHKERERIIKAEEEAREKEKAQKLLDAQIAREQAAKRKLLELEQEEVKRQGIAARARRAGYILDQRSAMDLWEIELGIQTGQIVEAEAEVVPTRSVYRELYDEGMIDGDTFNKLERNEVFSIADTRLGSERIKELDEQAYDAFMSDKGLVAKVMVSQENTRNLTEDIKKKLALANERWSDQKTKFEDYVREYALRQEQAREDEEENHNSYSCSCKACKAARKKEDALDFKAADLVVEVNAIQNRNGDFPSGGFKTDAKRIEQNRFRDAAMAVVEAFKNEHITKEEGFMLIRRVADTFGYT